MFRFVHIGQTGYQQNGWMNYARETSYQASSGDSVLGSLMLSSPQLAGLVSLNGTDTKLAMGSGLLLEYVLLYPLFLK